MPVYMIIDIEAKDPGTYAEYMEKVPATVIQLFSMAGGT